MRPENRLPRGMLCPVCGANGAVRLFELESPYIARCFYRIMRCRACGHRYADGLVTQDVLTSVYGAAFHASSQQAAAGPASAVMVNAQRRAKWLRDRGLRGNLLDVGAGRGYFVKAAQPYFIAGGIDYSEHAAVHGHEIGVHLERGDFLTAPHENGSFDVLTFWDVLAGMVDVRATCEKAARLLRPKGHAVFTVPMGDSLACRLSGRRWPLWIPPVNLHYFSEQSLAMLLRRSGFEIVDMMFQAKRVSLNFLLVKLARSIVARKFETRLASLSLDWAVPVNLRDIKTVLVRKA